MTPEQKDALRAPFDAKQIGKLPRVWCRACSDNKQQKHCAQHKLVKCEACGNKITEAHLHLDYVGHAATTDRLLQVDPEWTWEPAAVGPNGEPLLVNNGLWIRLTICGVTRLGFGDGGSVKEMIGDAIRNAAMRFGVALDLWAKEDLHSDSEGDPKPGAAPGSTKRETGGKPAASSSPSEADELTVIAHDLATHLIKVAEKLGAHDATVEAVARHRTSDSPEAFVAWLKRQVATADANLRQREKAAA